MWLDDDDDGKRIGRSRRRRRAPRRDGMLLVHANVAQQRSERVQRWGLALLIAALLGGVAWGLHAGAVALRRFLLVENPRFVLRTLDARSDGRLTPEFLIERAGLAGITRLFEADPRRIGAALSSLPSVKSVTVRRRLPDTLEIRVMERAPIARLAVPGAGYTDAVDREGVLLGPRFASPLLPLIEGVDELGLRPGRRLNSPAARAALAALDACETTRLYDFVRIQRIEIAADGGFALVLDNGDRALLPPGLDGEALRAKLRNLASINKAIRDLRLPRGTGPLRIPLHSEEVFPVEGLDVDRLATRPRR